jgi:hypothetical protein
MRNSKKATNVIKRLALMSAIAFFTVMMAGGSALMQIQRDPAVGAEDDRTPNFAVAPPKVENVFVTALSSPTKAGNAILQVQFAKGERVGSQVSLTLDDQAIVLNDEGTNGDERAGDGVHSSIAQLDLEGEGANFKRIEDTLNFQKKALTSPVFEDRLLVREIPLERVDFVPDQPVKLSPVSGTPVTVDPERSLVIRDPRVVEDPTRTFNPCTGVGAPMGKWTFGYLMREMANQAATGVDPSQFVREWLREWENDQTVNGWNVAKRLQIQNLIINPWQQASGGPGRPLDLAKAPFKLLAIVNRVDLRTNTVYGGGNAGEARFVFGAIGPNCQVLQFTVIFEYGINRSGCRAVRNWGRQWLNLSALPLGSAQYNAALEAITEQFARAGADPSKPNGSALNQLRTNEIALAAPWELREFRLLRRNPAGGFGFFLDSDTVKLTPDLSLNRTPTLTNYVNADTPNILAGTHNVPNQFPAGSPFLGGSSLTPFGTFWNNPAGGPFITNRTARFVFSLNTCNGCHAGETNTIFTHIKPVAFGSPAGLSGFMTGITVTDPADGAPNRTFNEFQRRALDLDTLVNSPCFRQIRFRPIPRNGH